MEPEYEAVSKEIFQLAAHFDPSWIFSVHPQLGFRWSWNKRYVGFHPKFDPGLRLMIPLVASMGTIHHVYGECSPWVFYKSLKNVRSLLLTVASEKGGIIPEFLGKCRKIIVQTETFQNTLLGLGVDPAKIDLIYPAVRDSYFDGGPSMQSVNVPPRVLFATAPRSEEEMEARGVHLLIHSAKAAPDVRFTFLYRPWRTGYTSWQPTRSAVIEAGLQNIELRNTVVADMSQEYRGHHFVVIPYTARHGGKECPNSLIEALACGVPALVSSACPFAYFVETHGCGVVFDPTPANLVKAIEKGLGEYSRLSSNASQSAKRYFSQAGVLKKYEAIYRDME